MPPDAQKRIKHAIWPIDLTPAGTFFSGDFLRYWIRTYHLGAWVPWETAEILLVEPCGVGFGDEFREKTSHGGFTFGEHIDIFLCIFCVFLQKLRT